MNIDEIQKRTPVEPEMVRIGGVSYSKGGQDLMVTQKNQLVHSIKAAITCVLILGTLSMIWPAVIALIIGAFLLINSWVVQEEFVVLTWPKVSNVLLVFTSLRQFSLLTIVW